MAASKCPICRKACGPRPQNTVFPFCSERCRLVDLGRWLGEEYRVAGQPEDSAAPAGQSDPGEERH